MDLTALRVERIRIGLQATERIVDLQARRHVAVLAVALTFAGTSLFAWLAGQANAAVTAAVVGVCAGLIAQQLRGLAQLAHLVEQSATQARQALDSLMLSEGERDDDDEATE